jgi:hypothetical protein
MYLRIVRGRFDPAASDALVALVPAIEAALAALPGHDHTHTGVDRANGQGVTVSTWDTEEHARFDRQALGEVVGKLQAAGMTLESPEVYELAGG